MNGSQTVNHYVNIMSIITQHNVYLISIQILRRVKQNYFPISNLTFLSLW